MECPIDSHMNQHHNLSLSIYVYVRTGSWRSLLCCCCSGELASANYGGFLFPHVCYGLIWMIDALDLYSVDGSRVIS